MYRSPLLLAAEDEANSLYIEMQKAKEMYYSLKARYARACRKVKETEIGKHIKYPQVKGK